MQPTRSGRRRWPAIAIGPAAIARISVAPFLLVILALMLPLSLAATRLPVTTRVAAEAVRALLVGTGMVLLSRAAIKAHDELTRLRVEHQSARLETAGVATCVAPSPRSASRSICLLEERWGRSRRRRGMPRTAR